MPSCFYNYAQISSQRLRSPCSVSRSAGTVLDFRSRIITPYFSCISFTTPTNSAGYCSSFLPEWLLANSSGRGRWISLLKMYSFAKSSAEVYAKKKR